jgi:single-stranded DNA-binding protein
MLQLMCSGSLTAEPVRRTTTKGNAYATFQIRTQAGADAVLVSCVVFDADAVAAVLQLRKGEAVSVTGRGELRHWTGKDGREGHGLSCTVDKLMNMRPVKREKVQLTRTKPAPTARSEPGNIEDMPSDLEEIE